MTTSSILIKAENQKHSYEFQNFIQSYSNMFEYMNIVEQYTVPVNSV